MTDARPGAGPRDPARIPLFDRRFFDGSERFTRIGDGALGGKAEGLARIREDILSRLDPAEFPGFTVAIPTLTVLATRCFDLFLERNGLREIALSGEPDDRIAHAFVKGDLPVELVGDLRALIEHVHTPLAVRSSSMLEDALEHPFAGVYVTKMIPNHRLDADTRFRRLAEAVKLVWASTFFAEAKNYRRSIGVDPGAEKMAVIVQEVVGRRRGDRYHPDVSGVARSYNYYASGHARPEDGVVQLALGLGRTIVDGGVAWTYCPAFPKAPPPYNSINDLLEHAQTRYWAVHMGAPPAYDPIRETEHLVELEASEPENDELLRLLVSTYDAESDRLVPGISGPGPRLLDFAPILALDAVPLNGLVRRLLALSQAALGAPVEIEFAVNLDPRRGLPASLGFLQVRPMAVFSEPVEVTEAELAGPGVLAASTAALGNGVADDVRDVVYLRPEAFAAESTPAIAREVEAVNRALAEAGRRYLLLGFGRWGSSDPWLGVPVTWGQISHVRAVVEATLPRMKPDLSQGSHFFHNLIACGVFYLSVPHDGGRPIDWAWLDAQPAERETRFVRHVRLARPLHLRVDGRSGRALIRCEDEHAA